MSTTAIGTELQQQLKTFFGFDTFKGRQEDIIRTLLGGSDVFVIMPTGGGKSLCYQLPALISEGTAIVVSPLIALMKNQVDSIRAFGSREGVAHFFNSSLSKGERDKVKEDIVAGITKILYVAPESLTKDENVEFLRSIKISFFAIDEAHCISEWGHDFRPEYRRLRPIIEAIDRVPIIALTATATPKVQMDILKNLGMQDAVVFKDSFNRPNLYYEVRPKRNVVKEIIKFVKQHSGKSGIIYCQSRKKVEELAATLQVNGINAVPYHAGMDAKTRTRNQDMFLMEEVEVIVATIAFGMGIDKPDVRFIIHHDMPKSLESYYQETGRAGRDGGEGICLAFYSYDDILKLMKLLSGKPVAEQEINKLLMTEVVAYAETTTCRRKMLLHYFGENFDEGPCGKTQWCDNCKFPKEKYDAKEPLEMVLRTILVTKEQFKAKHIVDVLVGNFSNTVKQYKHDKLEEFGEGKDEGEIFWDSVIRQALVNDFLVKNIEQYGTLQLSDKGRNFLEKPYSIMFTRERDMSGDADDDGEVVMNQKGGGALDQTLISLLRDLRKKIAKEKNLPPFVIFQDPSLEEMATRYPITMDELKEITGVGEGKAQKFGEAFLDLIRKYVEENEIERPQDMVVRTVANKSGLKVSIIQAVDRKTPLDEMARMKGVEMSEILDELESIVNSGTKLDLNYYVGTVFDDHDIEEIFDILRNSENASLDKVLEEYEDVYSEEELRLARIKFISDLGN
ncbi:MAG: DNA helicase RecQ [Flavobacteriales bacterium]|nr:DNA helicase RecQ [Flavobacteriales bacterium]MCX7650599.1 DNA helicase RecQ [Flavobacteriales bacterium]MDW8431551.1 DNA helicase RecQ [Flavobacteriales bacterium]